MRTNKKKNNNLPLTHSFSFSTLKKKKYVKNMTPIKGLEEFLKRQEYARDNRKKL